jgi:hypothetical protein
MQNGDLLAGRSFCLRFRGSWPKSQQETKLRKLITLNMEDMKTCKGATGCEMGGRDCGKV